MGYNNRAVRLHVLAQIIVDKHRGKVPNIYDALRELPGIGQYTARAILSSAFSMPEPIVDINVRRIFSRLFWKLQSAEVVRPESEIWSLATRLLPHRAAYDWNQALMDIGATICTARTPRCTLCPLLHFCKSRKWLQRVRTHRLNHHMDVHPGARSTGIKAAGVRGPGVRHLAIQAHSVRSVSKPEPSYRGVPNRIHRGRIVERLRRVKEGSWITVGALTRKVFEDSTKADVKWIERILRVLERDGLVQVKKKQARSVVRLG
jgi:A/G-specific adenine glycosylase